VTDSTDAGTPASNWTVNPSTGHADSSPRFAQVSRAISRILREKRGDLSRGEYSLVADTVTASLASDEGMVPRDTLHAEVTEMTRETDRVVTGVMVINGQTYSFTAANLAGYGSPAYHDSQGDMPHPITGFVTVDGPEWPPTQ
jgi:hypothetical protein